MHLSCVLHVVPAASPHCHWHHQPGAPQCFLTLLFKSLESLGNVLLVHENIHKIVLMTDVVKLSRNVIADKVRKNSVLINFTFFKECSLWSSWSPADLVHPSCQIIEVISPACTLQICAALGRCPVVGWNCSSQAPSTISWLQNAVIAFFKIHYILYTSPTLIPKQPQTIVLPPPCLNAESASRTHSFLWSEHFRLWCSVHSFFQSDFVYYMCCFILSTLVRVNLCCTVK